jgi:GT2 family glycosyltransferase
LSQEVGTNFEVLVVDSSPVSVGDWLRTTFPSVQLLHSASRLYPGAARNLGVEQSSAEVLAFVDADVILAPGWLDAAHRKLLSNPGIVAVGGVIANANPSHLASKLQYWAEFSDYMPGQKGGVRPALSSSNLLIHRKQFQNHGGFDAALRMGEDLLFSLQFPGKLYLEPAACVSHFNRTRFGSVLPHLRSLGYWSGLLRTRVDLPGSWLSAAPSSLAYSLVPYRTIRILHRVLRSDTRQGLEALLYSPLLLMVLTWWAKGFAAGIRDGKEKDL